MESTMLRDCESIPAGSDIGNSGEGLQRPSNTSNGEVHIRDETPKQDQLFAPTIDVTVFIRIDDK